MKQKKLQKKLVLNKKTVANLKKENQKDIVGGATYFSCYETLCTCETVVCCPYTEAIFCPKSSPCPIN